MYMIISGLVFLEFSGGSPLGFEREENIFFGSFLSSLLANKNIFTKNGCLFSIKKKKNVIRRQMPQPPSEGNMDKVRSTLRQCMRDWGAEGLLLLLFFFRVLFVSLSPLPSFIFVRRIKKSWERNCLVVFF